MAQVRAASSASQPQAKGQVGEIDFYRVANGKIVEGWSSPDKAAAVLKSLYT
jgi:predicted SnoaL-like aldol condensation-catalyzing enzyme